MMVTRLSRVEMVCVDPDEMVGFYRAAFGFQPVAGLDEVHGRRTLVLGEQRITLLAMPPDGRLYPAGVAGWSPLFHHIAIVVSDMARACARLGRVPGWTPISTAGPQLLPAASGGVTAFKFRDPDGHPLELIAFAPGAVPARWQINRENVCLGIDHSAVSVSDAPASIAFYESLGLKRSDGSRNIGPEQARLDDVANATVDVTALSPPQSTPHVELLGYLGDYNRDIPPQTTGDVAATRLVFAVENDDVLNRVALSHAANVVSNSSESGAPPNVMLRDPDGHLICLESEA